MIENSPAAPHKLSATRASSPAFVFASNFADMSLQPPKLPTWIFVVTNLALLAAAGFIAYNAHHPLTETTTFSIVACVIAGAIVGLVPIVAHYERRKNEMLDQRQRELEALGRTISTSAEQISIAANGFNEITDLAWVPGVPTDLGLPHVTA